MKVCIIGSGGWGTALGLVLHGSGASVNFWSPFEDELAEIRIAGENRKYLPNVPLPADLFWTSDPQEAARGANLAVLATPSRYMADVAGLFRTCLAADADVVSVSKGLCEHSYRRMSEVAADCLGRSDVAALSGPSHAEEVARGIPTAVVVAAHDDSLAMRLQKTFSGERFRVYRSGDPAGVELGGALKNVIAIAVGISDGLGFGDNTRAALITRGLAEVTRLGLAMGASAETFAGLSGMGDLVVTCTSRHSRNRGVGERLGRGETLAEIRRDMVQVAEGVWNCPVALALAARKGVEMPISTQVQAVLDGAIAPGEAVEALMEREIKPEHK